MVELRFQYQKGVGDVFIDGLGDAFHFRRYHNPNAEGEYRDGYMLGGLCVGGLGFSIVSLSYLSYLIIGYFS